MRDIGDTNTLRLEIINEPEQTLDFDCGQGRCRLVQNQDPGVMRPCPGNFDDRLLSQPQIPQRRFRVDVPLQPVKNFAGAQQLRLLVDMKPEPRRLALSKGIFGKGQFGKRFNSRKTVPIPDFTASSLARNWTRAPSTMIWPSVSVSTPAVTFINVGLPAPFSRTSTLTAPMRKSKSTPFSARGARIDLFGVADRQSDWLRVAHDRPAIQ